MAVFQIDETRDVKASRAFLVCVTIGRVRYADSAEELRLLVTSDGLEPCGLLEARREKPDPATFLGSGKIEELGELAREAKADVVVFDTALSAAQQRNIERAIELPVLDRTTLILEIFRARAKSREGRLQVELARLEHLSTRLVRGWTHLERQRGGLGKTGGPGEKQIELDRRMIGVRVKQLLEQLKKLARQRGTQRRARTRGDTLTVSLVGYTNVGKSTLMNLLSKSDVFAENKLFATLDTTVRKVIIDNLPFLLSDTVGFIRKLPTDLVDSFKSTLDEVREADLLLHVVDIAHPDFEDQIQVVEKTLGDLGCSDKPCMIVFNKIDAYDWVEKEEDDLTPVTKENVSLDDLMKTWMARRNDNCIFISAREKTNLEELKKVLYDKVRELHVQKYPYNDFLFEKYDEEGA